MLDTQPEVKRNLRKRQGILPESIRPIGLSRIQAAAYYGISPTLFDRMVRDRMAPEPTRIYGRVVWDRRKLDSAFASLSDGPGAPVQHDIWDRMAV